MANFRAQVVTPWTEAREFLIGELLQAGDSAMDATGQQELLPDPNLLTVELWCVQATLDATAADNRFQVLWSEEITDETP